MENLYSLGKLFQTDKCHASHTFNNSSYLDIYESYFSEYRNKNISILELGVKEGRSLKVWEEYFPNAKIAGLDIDTSNINMNLNRSKLYLGSQDDIQILNDISNDFPEGFDIIIDDASHLNQMILCSFNFLWPMLKPAGLYIIEDLRNSYDWNIEKQMILGKWHVAQPIGTNMHNDRNQLNKLFFDMIKEMDYLRGELAAIHFWPMLAILKKVG